jgi:hypothetical protein
VGSGGVPKWSATSQTEAIVRLVGAILVEQNDKWAVKGARYTTLERRLPSGNRRLTCPAHAGSLETSTAIHHFQGQDSTCGTARLKDRAEECAVIVTHL